MKKMRPSVSRAKRIAQLRFVSSATTLASASKLVASATHHVSGEMSCLIQFDAASHHLGLRGRQASLLVASAVIPTERDSLQPLGVPPGDLSSVAPRRFA